MQHLERISNAIQRSVTGYINRRVQTFREIQHDIKQRAENDMDDFVAHAVSNFYLVAEGKRVMDRFGVNYYVHDGRDWNTYPIQPFEEEEVDTTREEDISKFLKNASSPDVQQAIRRYATSNAIELWQEVIGNEGFVPLEVRLYGVERVIKLQAEFDALPPSIEPEH